MLENKGQGGGIIHGCRSEDDQGFQGILAFPDPNPSRFADIASGRFWGAAFTPEMFTNTRVSAHNVVLCYFNKFTARGQHFRLK